VVKGERYSDIVQRQISRKWYKIKLYLQWQTDRKSYMIYLSNGVIFNDTGWP